MKMYSVYDVKAEVFDNTRIFLCTNRGMAIRSFLDAASEQHSTLNKFPADFMLFELGDFDERTGGIVRYDAKFPVGSVMDLRAQK